MIAFYICIIVYLYGDLAIYAVTVPQSLQITVCPQPVRSTHTERRERREKEQNNGEEGENKTIERKEKEQTIERREKMMKNKRKQVIETRRT